MSGNADDDLDLDLDGNDDSDVDAGSGDDAALPDGTPAKAANQDKRVSDLTSKWQKAEARAKKAEAALAARDNAGAGDSAGQPTQVGLPDDMVEWVREKVHAEDPRFMSYGIGTEAITGRTPAEMRAVAKAIGALIDKVETSVRNRVLEEHGVIPSTAGGGDSRGSAIGDVASMKSDEFEALIERAKRGEFAR